MITTAPLWLLWLAACGDPVLTTVPRDQARRYALAVDVPLYELEFAPNSRPGGLGPTGVIPLAEFAKNGTTKKGRGKWEVPLPVRPRGLYFNSPPDGTFLKDARGAPLRYKKAGEGELYWLYDADTLTIFTPHDGDLPPGPWTLEYPSAIFRENALNFSMSGIQDKEDFAKTEIQADWTSWSGLLLNAPAKASWKISVPPSGELSFHPGLVEPEIQDGPGSDGVRITAEVETASGVEIVWEQEVKTPAFPQVRVDLERWAGQDVTLRFQVDPLGTTDFDYAFVAEPMVQSRVADPRRVVWVFIDTLRPDHLELFGGPRQTAPELTTWAEKAAVFQNARSVAPWTLPSARSVLTGRQPEFFESSPTIQSILRKEGYATAMYAGNLYLSPKFGIHRDWGKQHVTLTPTSEEQIRRASAWLDENPHSDSFLLLHFMDAHLPYQEPEPWRRIFAGDAPKSLGENFTRNDVLRGIKGVPNAEELTYIQDRYDNNIRYIQDQLVPFLAKYYGDDDVVVLFSDHGEEFWDHGQFEHGHTLYDELLRVPMIIKAPGLKAGKVSEPSSLLDLMPTTLELLGLEAPPKLQGQSLVAVAQGDEAAKEKVAARHQAFGHPLYGTDRWGVLDRTEMYMTNEGREWLFDLKADPDEKLNLLQDAPTDLGQVHRDKLGEVLDRPVVVAYRLTASNGNSDEDLIAEVSVPGGWALSFIGDDPTGFSMATVTTEGDLARITWPTGYPGSREVYLVPKGPYAEVTHQVKLTATMGNASESQTVSPDREPVMGKVRTTLVRARGGRRIVTLTWGISPVPDDTLARLSGSDPELAAMLGAMGYVTNDAVKKAPQQAVPKDAPAKDSESQPPDEDDDSP